MAALEGLAKLHLKERVQKAQDVAKRLKEINKQYLRLFEKR